MIQQPGISSPGDKFVPADNKGALLLFFPTAFQSQVKTAHGEQDAITARIVRLNDGAVYDNAMVFSTALVTQLKSAVPDGIVLGTLDQGENTKGNPPWLLRPHDAQQVAQAEAWMAANPRVQQAPQPTPPAPQQWGAPTPPAAPAWGAPAAPATPQWGAPPAPAAPSWGDAAAQQYAPPASPEGITGQAPAAWQNAGAPVPPPAPAAQPNPNEVAAKLTSMGVTIPPGCTLETLMSLAAVYGIQ